MQVALAPVGGGKEVEEGGGGGRGGEGGAGGEGGEGEEGGDAGCTGPRCSPAYPLPFLPPPTYSCSQTKLQLR